MAEASKASNIKKGNAQHVWWDLLVLGDFYVQYISSLDPADNSLSAEPSIFEGNCQIPMKARRASRTF